MKTRTLLALAILTACYARADRLIGNAVLIAQDGTTIPSNTVATPTQVDALGADADAVRADATNIQVRAEACADKVRLYSTNYVVTSTVYVQSIGGVPYDPSNQTVRLYGLIVTDTNVQVTVTVRQVPLVTPTIDWRATLGTSGVWSNMAATAEAISVPAGVTNAAAAYRYTFDRPASTSFFIRAVDNSSGASGSGLWWIVFGGINVDGKRGYTGDIVVTVDGQTFTLPYHGGILSQPVPLGGE